MGLIPGQGTKIPHASGQLSPRTTTRQPQQNKAVAKTRKAHAQQREVHVPQWSACTLQLRPSTVKIRGFPCGSAGKKSTCNVGDLGSISRLERSPGEGNGYPLQCSCILVWRIPWAVQSIGLLRLSLHFTVKNKKKDGFQKWQEKLSISLIIIITSHFPIDFSFFHLLIQFPQQHWWVRCCYLCLAGVVLRNQG